MSTAEQAKHKTLPPLEPGQRLDQPTFRERYEAMPPDTWAELLGGVVYMPSPVRNDHGESNENLSVWTGLYKRSTTGLRGGRNSTVILDELGEAQPDGHLRIPQALGGQTRVERDYIIGAPELVIEIARSSRSYDLNEKKADYERAGFWSISWSSSTRTAFTGSSAAASGLRKCGLAKMGSIARELFPNCGLIPKHFSPKTSTG
jgi:hypothetical protein